ncbi:MAG: AMP-dependent synthetase and ligase [Verrucomicrobia bacterium]|nr:AMP-dependent synthetase and ligase [Verrucomicrobiota bacterium]
MPPPALPSANIARHLAVMAAAQPGLAALKVPRGRTAGGDIDYLTLTFAQLDTEVSAWGKKLTDAGVKPGDRTLVMVKPGLPLIAAVFALFRIGAVPVVIDPGMGLGHFLKCVARSRPRVLLGIPVAQFASRLFRPTFSTVEIRVKASPSLTAQLATSGNAAALSDPAVHRASTDLAAILFTSGSTGAPKGVCYEHGMFEAQVRLIRETYAIAPGEIDLPMLPIFALFNPALGMTTVVPEIDPRRPAEVDPAKIVQAIRQENVTTSFGSPTLWLKVGEYCSAQKITLPSLYRVLSAGAPVPAALWESSRYWMPNGRLHSPYGATEALPIASIASNEVDLRAVRGACVGRRIAGIDVRIIRITDSPITMLGDTVELPANEIGEIIVHGPVVTKTYDAQSEATAQAKIEGPDINSEEVPADLRIPDVGLPRVSAPNAVWHRMGDCGFLDYSGRLWFCGRKAERVETAAGAMFTEPCEQVFRRHPRVTRCALVGLGERGQQRPALIVEAPLARSHVLATFARELRSLALQQAHTSGISLFFFRPRFPLDIRHNAKIHRLTLARWAAKAKGIETAAR